METRGFIKIAIFSLLVGLFLNPSLIYAYDDKTTHPALTDEIANFYKKSFPKQKLDDVEKEAIIQGSIDEDKGTRWFQHYYDPVYNRGLDLGFTSQPGFASMGSLFSNALIWQSSREWARATQAQSSGNKLAGILGIFTPYFGDPIDYSWERGIYEYTWGDKQRGLESLGHILHLVEDASVPDHTRNDPHPNLENLTASTITPALLTNYFSTHVVTNGSPYEGYAVFGRGSLNIAEEIKSEKPIILNTLDEYFTSLATYSNNYFLSGDTINNEKYASPKLDKRKKIFFEDSTNEEYIIENLGVEVIPLAKIDHQLDLKNNKIIEVLNLKDNHNLILSGYWSLLSRQAVLHGAGVVKLFFDDVEKEKQTKALYNKNRSWLGRQMDGFKSGAFAVASLFYGSSVKESDLVEPAHVAETITPPQENALPPETSVISLSENTQEKIEPPVDHQSNNQSSTQSNEVFQARPLPLQSQNPPLLPQPSPVKPLVAPPQQAAVSQSVSAGFGGGEQTPPPRPPPAASLSDAPPPPPPPVIPPPPPPAPVVDTEAPGIVFAINECSHSLSTNGCLLATTTVTLLWSSPDVDVDHYILECTRVSVPCDNFSFASTTATTTIYTFLANNTPYAFSAQAVDASGNISAAHTISLDVALHPVVINEIAWPGTSATRSQDQWIELFNPTEKTIDLSQISLKSLTDENPAINLSGPLEPHAYYLIESNDTVLSDITASTTASFALSIFGETLALEYLGTIIDQTPELGVCATWCGGQVAGAYYTMERDDLSVSGASPSNWGTWAFFLGNGKNADGMPINGTPGKRNSINYLIEKSGDLIASKTITKTRSPYLIPGAYEIRDGATLTIEPGVIIKFLPFASLRVDGILSAEGTVENPIIFTSLKDDWYGGDTNQDATSTTPNPGDWGSLRILANHSTFDHARVRYGGWRDPVFATHYANIRVENASASITNSIIEQSDASGIKLKNAIAIIEGNTIQNNANASAPGIGILINDGTVTVRQNTITHNGVGMMLQAPNSADVIVIKDNTFTGNTNEAIQVVEGYPAFSGNSAAGNGINGIRIQGGAFTRDYSFSRDLPYVITNSAYYTVADGSTLTIPEGTIIKLQGFASFSLSGKLIAEGTATAPIVFTSLFDDDCGIPGGCGDTDNVSTTPHAGDWQHLSFLAGSSSSTLTHTIIRYGGTPFVAVPEKGAVRIQDASLALRHVTIEKNYLFGIWMSNSTSTSLTDSLVQDQEPALPNQSFGMFLTAASTPFIQNTHFKNNPTHILNADGMSVYTDGGGNEWE